MAAADVILITVGRHVSLMGKTWWTLMLALRPLLLLLAGFTLFSDEQERFVCNTIQPGCSNVCFDAFAPVSVFRLWLLQLVLLCVPHAVFVTYVAHETMWRPSCGDRGRAGSPFTLENSGSSGGLSLSRAPLHELPHDWALPRFYCAYILVVILRILLEVVFGAGQFFLFGLSIPKSFLCYEAPCTSGVECYVSRRTEKTLMLYLMLGVTALSVLLSLVDLVSSMKAMSRWSRKSEIYMEMSKGEQSSVFTTSATEDTDVPTTRRTSPSGSSKDGRRAETHSAAVLPRGLASANQTRPDRTDAKTGRSATPTGTPVPTHFVLHSHQRPQLPNTTVAAPMGVKTLGQYSPVGANPGQQSDSSESPKDKKAWV